MKVSFNGNLLPSDEATLNLNNRGYNYGDSLFETMRVINSKIMFWETHYFRLMSSMRILRMSIPMDFSPEFLEEKIIELVKANDLESSAVRVKINIHREAGGYYTPERNSIGYFISVKPLDGAFFTISDDPYEVELYKDHYVLSGMLSTIKSNNKLVNILAGIYAKENGFDNCFLINQNKSVLEMTNGNVFIIKGKEIKTPPLSDGCLNGIIRKQLIEILNKSEDFTLKEETVSPFELQKADEIFFTNAIQGIQPITKYRKKSYTNTVARNLVGKLNAKARLVDI
ncbi:aminotransferase class IV [Psychroflexus gondwanensis]|jgi:branched-chain amino acid aminotransferase|uniref:branched-chain-amino-acid transaminase n=1 Tax=Psychroflexus gondwanensis ACAM 44 TaxID=1189619 RepID=N1WMF3_9FLAO|nr:aminotransferase class IV [Psychroflexus gondwanensis]EMY81456.1 4-amino-4-deoxychorismate lyase PabC [Psychroflexus gondwanensis ACAM 44]TXE21068.1 aminotransferase class IV [Psychroflexus gondwanensis]